MNPVSLLRSPIFLAMALAASCLPSMAADDYKIGPDSMVKPGVPQGSVEKFTFKDSKVFPGTVRDCWIYVPKQYDGSKPAALMVFCDGGGFVNTNGQFRVPAVFDNLIASKEMPVTIALFINPGNFPAAEKGQKDRSNRSFEYDSPTDLYAKFLIEEMLPPLEAKYKITKDPAGRAICGNSSGGICAFVAAWERPDVFGKVVSHIGSFTNIRGGYIYPPLIRRTKTDNAKNYYKTPEELTLLENRRKIRVFLQDGSNDLDNLHGNWPLANQDMAAALKYAGWDFQFVLGDGAHSGKHGGAIFPETMRWLWRDSSK
ncbi:MAG TPA: alpha/beta hydrolase-fold protein [Roseimicrobium sp.]|nr:alpha/beta hydrolase-fold protein [Roseimicrobium sp.]